MKIINKELFGLLKDKEKLVNEGRKISVKIESLETQRNKLALQVQKIKDKIIPIVMKETEGKLGKYEDITEVITTPVINEVEIHIYDELEQFKKFLDEKIAKKNETANSES